MEETLKQKIIDVKKELRASMNGVASAAMRQSADYRVNFGVELPRLQDIAQEFGQDHELAQALWKENVRECKILAAIIQPADTFYPEIADIWVESIRTLEIAQYTCLLLFRRLRYATDKAFQWIADEGEMQQVCGYLTMCHVVRQAKLNDRSAEELEDQATAALACESAAVRNSAMKVLAFLRDE